MASLLQFRRSLLLLLCGASFALADTPFYHRVRMAHTAIGPLTFALFMPLGAIAIRTVRGGTWLHAGWMSFCYALLIAQLGMGIWMALDSDQFDEFHCYIGIVVIACLCVQPLTGLLHHYLYKKTGGRRTVSSYAHMAWGMALITLGIIDGGFGLQLSHEKKRSTYIVYAVLSGVIWFAWMVISVISQVRRTQGAGPVAKEEEGEAAVREEVANVKSAL